MGTLFPIYFQRPNCFLLQQLSVFELLSVFLYHLAGLYPVALWRQHEFRQAAEVRRRAAFFHIRLPRMLLCAAVGMTLAISGTLMQALFRNPIVEPDLVGTSAGAALGAAVLFVLGSALSWANVLMLGRWCCRQEAPGTTHPHPSAARGGRRRPANRRAWPGSGQWRRPETRRRAARGPRHRSR